MISAFCKSSVLAINHTSPGTPGNKAKNTPESGFQVGDIIYVYI